MEPYEQFKKTKEVLPKIHTRNDRIWIEAFYLKEFYWQISILNSIYLFNII
jgi:hypothetical protein